MENILKFQDRICYLDYLVFNPSRSHTRRITEIIFPFNFIDSFPKEFTDHFTQINSKEHLNSDFYFTIGIVRVDSEHYYRKKSGNITHYLKNHLGDIRMGLYVEDLWKAKRVTMLLNKEEHMPSKDCKKLLLEFYNSKPLPDIDYYDMLSSIIDKIK
jgi:hypothetical protein